jgi:hypothetical protein
MERHQVRLPRRWAEALTVSRLDSFIRRLEAQRRCLAVAADAVRELPGVAIEFGLGNGRTYDHLRKLLAGRPLFALDRQVTAHPDCVPDAAHLVLGDFRDTVPALTRRLGASAALAHADIGSSDEAASRALARWLAPALDPMLVSGAVVVSDQDMAPALALGWSALSLPEDVPAERYFLYRKR